eukprot:9845872-Lingulodinium_polyedra.AAC.1
MDAKYEKEMLEYVIVAPDNIKWVVSEQEFIAMLLARASTAPGPDGLPYAVYQAAAALGARLLYALYLAMVA